MAGGLSPGQERELLRLSSMEFVERAMDGKVASALADWPREVSALPHGATFVEVRAPGAPKSPLARVAARMLRGAPASAVPRTLLVAYVDLDVPKRLPRRSARLTPRHINSGVTLRRGTECATVLVFRRQQRVKVLVHELLHALGLAAGEATLACEAKVEGAALALTGERPTFAPRRVLARDHAGTNAVAYFRDAPRIAAALVVSPGLARLSAWLKRQSEQDVSPPSRGRASPSRQQN